MIAAPTRTLAPQARLVWGAAQLGLWGALAIGAAMLSQVDALDWWPLVAAVVGLVVCVPLVPILRWRRWRWDVQEPGIDIRHGLFSVRQTLVPWVRVQHVETRRGVLEQAMNLATVVVHTAAGSHTIPLLAEKDAEELRDRIAELARTDPDA
ncbi:PH domain-containing protein [Solirubrobacter phytolaccae]|uniref:PH domain-containing protein n=1 Tax=Solirubrobacter phytolaccae TaxID=1404360 RepID=A0A9X3SFS3_9ACTN|nr:PH domain-containing protein [Solirubrobacter phytolaccae]MDA0181757.1 PH domain-containing protein [Solirubrobacter phytolaccae]